MKEQDTGEVDALREENERLRSINQVRDDSIRAEARAEALREAVKRADEWALCNLGPLIMGSTNRLSLRAAILADHTIYAGKRAEDVQTVREGFGKWWDDTVGSGQWTTLERLAAHDAWNAALDRIIRKEE